MRAMSFLEESSKSVEVVSTYSSYWNESSMDNLSVAFSLNGGKTNVWCDILNHCMYENNIGIVGV
jgi:hypothetical protein